MPDTMIRKQIYIHKWQNRRLKQMAEQRSISEAEIIRQALERELKENDSAEQAREDALQNLAAFARALRERPEFSQGKPYRWDRQELYDDRELRQLKPPGG